MKLSREITITTEITMCFVDDLCGNVAIYVEKGDLKDRTANGFVIDKCLERASLYKEKTQYGEKTMIKVMVMETIIIGYTNVEKQRLNE